MVLEAAVLMELRLAQNGINIGFVVGWLDGSILGFLDGEHDGWNLG